MTAGTPQGDWAAEASHLERPTAKAFGWSDLFSPATLAGVADSGVVLLLARGLNVSQMVPPLERWYVFITVGKLILLGITWNQRSPLSGPAKWLIGSTAAMVLATTLAGVSSFGPYAGVAGFLVNLTLTSMLIGQRPLRQYLLGPVLIISSTALWHAILCFTHRMPIWFGRYFYFGFNTFNLGGEIEAIGCMAAALLLPRMLSLPVIAVLLVDMSLLEARSAILVGFATMFVVLVFDGRRQLHARRALAILVIAPVAGLGLAALGGGSKISDFVSSVLLINDPYRGVATGGSGRTGLWAQSLEMFQQSPVIGHDLSYFESVGFIGSHNLFLQGLAQYGLMSLLFFGSLIYGFVFVFSRDKYRFCVLACALPLLLFNDRFANLNPYPFMFFVLLTLPAAKAAATATQASAAQTYVRRAGVRGLAR
jgi:hypothetical protein